MTRYYLAEIIRTGDGSDEEPHGRAPAVNGFGLSWRAAYPLDLDAGLPALCLVRGDDHSALQGATGVYPFPPLALADAISAAPEDVWLALEDEASWFGLDLPWREVGTFGALLQAVGVQIDGAFDLSSFWVSA